MLNTKLDFDQGLRSFKKVKQQQRNKAKNGRKTTVD